MPEQHIPDVTVRSNDYLPDPDVKMPHIEWYPTSWEMNVGSQLDDLAKEKTADTADETEPQEIATEQSQTIHNADRRHLIFQT